MSSIVALEWLLQHSNDDNLNVPLTGEQLWQIDERHARNPFRADPTVSSLERLTLRSLNEIGKAAHEGGRGGA